MPVESQDLEAAAEQYEQTIADLAGFALCMSAS